MPEALQVSVLRVLLADDHEELREGYAAYLRRIGLQVATARNGVEAVEEALRLVPDVIVMDLCMPELSGDEATAAIKSHARTRHIAVIALSGLDPSLALPRARAAGCQAVLPKTCLPRELAAMIGKLGQENRELPAQREERAAEPEWHWLAPAGYE
jgi:CheY-like chemotaxis protein